ncbi:hypothetical protein C8R46DRAFT_1356001, partial [Mycena filopes]
LILSFFLNFLPHCESTPLASRITLGIIHNSTSTQKITLVNGKVAPPEKGSRCFGGSGPQAGNDLPAVGLPVCAGLPAGSSKLPAGGLPASGRGLSAGGGASAAGDDLPATGDDLPEAGDDPPTVGGPPSGGGEAGGDGSSAGRRCRVLLRCYV